MTQNLLYGLVNGLAVAVVLGIIVFVHELGHFLAAKSFGVKVETFSLGFGKRLFGWRRGDTDYRISVLPLGGYVKMSGENPADVHTGQPYEFLSKPRWQRFVIAIAGPAMNFVLAIALLVPVCMHSYQPNGVAEQPAVVAAVEPNSPAAAAGIERDDRIVSIDGVANPNWKQVETRAGISVDHAISVALLRRGSVVHTTLTPRQLPDGEATIGLSPYEPITISSVTQDSPAQRAGLQQGDRLATLNGARVIDYNDWLRRFQAAASNGPGAPVAVHIGVERNGQLVPLELTPRWGNNNGHQQWMMGAVIMQGPAPVSLPFGAALRESVSENEDNSMLVLVLVGKLVSHKATIRSLQSPIGMSDIAGDAVREVRFSPAPLLFVTSMISVNLGVLNLLPIPVLDGGMILFLVVEGLLRHDISLRVKERVYQAGFAFLVILMTVAVYNDILRKVHH